MNNGIAADHIYQQYDKELNVIRDNVRHLGSLIKKQFKAFITYDDKLTKDVIEEVGGFNRHQ